MRKLITFAIIATAVIGLNAQDMGTTVVLLNPNAVQKKVDKSDEEIKDPKKNDKAATWLKRGDLYQDVFNIGLEQTQEGMDPTMLTLFYKEPISIDTETLENGTQKETYNYEYMKYVFENGVMQTWERVNPMREDPLAVSIEAYMKTLELDEAGKLSSKVKEGLNSVKSFLKREGVNFYYLGDYDEALASFEDVLKINNLDLYAGEVDTTMIQYSGIIAREIAGETDNKELYKKSIEYYEQLAAVGFGGPNTYLQIHMDYQNLGDTLASLEILKDAYEKYPDTLAVIANIANTYIVLKQYEEGLAFMDQVIEKNPTIGESQYWKGRILINMESVETIEAAIEAYKKAGELKPSLYYVWYDLGFIYYLQGADFFDRSNEETDEDMRGRLIEAGNQKYQEAIPILEKAYELNDENREVKYETLDVLQRIYYKLEMNDQYERVRDLKNTI